MIQSTMKTIALDRFGGLETMKLQSVKGLKPGDRVYAFGLLNPKGGFYAEYAAVKADDVSPSRTQAQAAVAN
jgi:NADPH:quinone reductase-like Zn-dependent oxidoreductase